MVKELLTALDVMEEVAFMSWEDLVQITHVVIAMVLVKFNAQIVMALAVFNHNEFIIIE